MPSPAAELADLGRALFFDTGLSLNGNQACASCHNPAAAFSDNRDNGVGGAVSLGTDGKSLGDRNAPTITYASLIPEFGLDDTGVYAGGFFHDGRARSLNEQAGEPFTNPIEMALPDNEAVVRKVLARNEYVASLREHFGESVLLDPVRSFAAITESISAYERTPEFMAFDSRYDRFLLGELELTRDEEVGRMLFFSQLINCHSCHLIDEREFRQGESFSTFRYHNIGLPVNNTVRAKNGLGVRHRDNGLAENDAVASGSEAGKFRVPTLRNVAVTGPYMHNGIFQELETAIRFYNRFTLTDRKSQVNPETGDFWGEPEVVETVDLELLQQGQPISDLQVKALIAFLRALTDRRYEHLLNGPDDIVHSNLAIARK
jgi:cytochrome c peroxidase